MSLWLHFPWQFVTILLLLRLACATPPYPRRSYAAPLYSQCYLVITPTKAELRCPSFLPADVKSLIEGLLIRDPLQRLGSGATDIKELEAHESFSNLPLTYYEPTTNLLLTYY